MPNVVKCFFDIKKVATACSPLLNLSMMDWDRLKRWSSVDLALLKRDRCLLVNPICSRWERRLCSMTISNSFIIELIKLMGLLLVVKEGSLSSFSNIRRVAIFHAVGV